MALVLVACYALATVVAHATWCRLPPAGLSSALKLVLSGGLVGAVLTAHLLAIFGISVPTLAGMLSFALFVELYLFFSTLIVSSVSVSWLRRLYKRTATVAEIQALCSPSWMVRTRIERLQQNGFIVQAGDGEYRITEKGLRMMRTFGRMRSFFKHAPR